jgi:putative membrane protein
MKHVKLAAVCTAVAVAWSSVTIAQQQGSQGRNSDTKHSLKQGERKFIETAAQHNLAEVQIGKIAESKAASPEAKKFGQQMAQDHGQALQEITQLAKAKAISIPSEPDRSHQREAKNLEKLSGPEFDRKYMASMVKDHEKDVKEFRKMARDAKDPDVRALAEKTLPVLEGHLKMAREVAATTGSKR